MLLLYVDSVIRSEDESRTAALCNEYLKMFREKYPDAEIKRVVLKDEGLKPLLYDDVQRRNDVVAEKNTNDEILKYANDFKEADIILIGAPYWDMSFPSVFRVYIERICACGITFKYTEDGALGLCKAEKVVYITSAGGYINDLDFGAGYVKGLCQNLLGIKGFERYSAEGLDIIGSDIDAIMSEAKSKLKV